MIYILRYNNIAIYLSFIYLSIADFYVPFYFTIAIHKYDCYLIHHKGLNVK